MSDLHPTQATHSLGEEILAVNAVSHGYDKAHGELLILDGVNLSLRAGEIVGLLGRSGSGKSTLLRIIAGLVTPHRRDGELPGAAAERPPPKASPWCFKPSRCSPG